MGYNPVTPSEQTAATEIPAAIVPTTTEQAFTLTPGFTLPANMLTVGKTAIIRVRGLYTTVATIGTLTARIKLGGITVGSATISALNLLQTNQNWQVDLELLCLSTGTNGVVDSFGELEIGVNGGAGQTVKAGLQVVTLNTTIDNALSLTVQSSSIALGNSIQPRHVRMFVSQ